MTPVSFCVESEWPVWFSILRVEVSSSISPAAALFYAAVDWVVVFPIKDWAPTTLLSLKRSYSCESLLDSLICGSLKAPDPDLLRRTRGVLFCIRLAVYRSLSPVSNSSTIIITSSGLAALIIFNCRLTNLFLFLKFFYLNNSLLPAWLSRPKEAYN